MYFLTSTAPSFLVDFSWTVEQSVHVQFTSHPSSTSSYFYAISRQQYFTQLCIYFSPVFFFWQQVIMISVYFLTCRVWVLVLLILVISSSYFLAECSCLILLNIWSRSIGGHSRHCLVLYGVLCWKAS